MRTRMRSRGGVAAGILALLAASAAGQPPPAPVQDAQDAPVFRTTTELVVRAVGVVDRDGRPVQGLTAADFLVTENGEPQEVAFAEYQRLAPSAAPGGVSAEADRAAATGRPGAAPDPALADPERDAAAPPVSAPPVDVVDRQRDETGRAAPDPLTAGARPVDLQRYRDRRLLVLYFDLSTMPPGDAARAWEAALDFLDRRMQPADLVALMTFRRGVVRLQHDFTGDRDALRATIFRLLAEDAGAAGLTLADLGAFGQNDTEFTLFQTDRQLSALQTAMASFVGHAQRTTLVYFGSHLRLTARHNQAQYRATVNAAIRANVSINPVDARGLVAAPPLGDASVASPSGVGLFDGSFAAGGLRRFEQSQDALHALAADTGGVALTDHNDLALGIVRAAEAVGDYYVLAWYSTHTEPDGRVRRVRIELAGDRDAELTYRRAYFGPKAYSEFSAADRERQLEEALMAEHAITDLSLGLTVHWFQLNSAEYYVPLFVTVPGRELTAAPRRRGARVTLDLLAEVRTAYGVTVQNLRDRLEIDLSEAEAREVAARPVQYETGFTLLPDDYVVRVLVRDATTGRIGTYETTFTVPNLERVTGRVPLSALVLSGQRVAAGQELHRVDPDGGPPAVEPLVRGGAKLMPSATGIFRQGRNLHVLVEAYQRAAGAAGNPLVAYVGLYRDGARVVETPPLLAGGGAGGGQDAPDPRDPPKPRPWAAPLHFTTRLDVPPGRYECQVSVLDPQGQRAAFARAPLVVVP